MSVSPLKRSSIRSISAQPSHHLPPPPHHYPFVPSERTRQIDASAGSMQQQYRAPQHQPQYQTRAQQEYTQYPPHPYQGQKHHRYAQQKHQPAFHPLTQMHLPNADLTDLGLL
ncbi:hypothetical protein D9615_008802 [Tricholomella constricta]|uniref:Uncharacterized protein n=1 Tax=Tricholomella constricta TaxID=117010 RepID=A0A8H5H811_9AGAR|nr:hypothetical protein D9615_008802 [Tricholomella constricta]